MKIKQEQDNLTELSKFINVVLNETLNLIDNQESKCKGTTYHYIMGQVNNKKVCYTKAKTYYKGVFGHYSWIETHFKNGKIKRTKIVRSGTKTSCEKRAEKLLKKLNKSEE